MRRIALTHGWEGWTFGPYGRASAWRLHSPTGDHYTADEIAEIRRLALELDFFQTRVRALEALVESQCAHFTDEELSLLRAASGILAKLPRRALRRAA
jgi:hypothetical protein